MLKSPSKLIERVRVHSIEARFRLPELSAIDVIKEARVKIIMYLCIGQGARIEPPVAEKIQIRQRRFSLLYHTRHFTVFRLIKALIHNTPYMHTFRLNPTHAFEQQSLLLMHLDKSG